jgi:hypothetical protein
LEAVEKSLGTIDWNDVEETAKDQFLHWQQIYKTFSPDSLPTLFFNGEKFDLLADVMGQTNQGDGYEVKTIRSYSRHTGFLQMLLMRDAYNKTMSPLEILESDNYNLFTRNSKYFDLEKDKFPFLRKQNSILQWVKPSHYSNLKPSEIQLSVWILWPKSCGIIDKVKQASNSSAISFRWAVFSSQDLTCHATKVIKDPFRSYLNLDESKTYLIINSHVIGPIEEQEIEPSDIEGLIEFELNSFFATCLKASKPIK